MAMKGNGDEPKLKFLSGVIEGFYGRPWSNEQRKTLFQWMKQMQLNVYLYAPKDDVKHRANWRDLYNPAELAELSEIIHSARSCGVRFVYSVSPGLSITFSSEEDRKGLLAKFKQITDLGCEGFALLFDDIDPELCAEDVEAFPSPGIAQADLTNELFHQLERPHPFLFCPTEYCSSRARPSVSQSPYLRDLGNHLDNGVDILWTGPLVLSRFVNPEEMTQTLVPTLQRAPVLWDNLHNNDYDMRRLHLGPLDGRPVGLRSGALRGLLCNPNVQMEANFVPLHTLGQWCQVAREEDYVRQQAHMRAVSEWMEQLYPEGSWAALDEKKRLSVEDLCYLSDVFYLPYEYGPTARRYLDSARWLLHNMHLRTTLEFGEREEYVRHCCGVWKAICSKLSFLPNREVAYILLPYCFDVRFVCGAILRYILCLKTHSRGAHIFRLEANEAWDLRSGWFSEVENLLPDIRLESSTGLARSLSDPTIFVVRPLLPTDAKEMTEMRETLNTDLGKEAHPVDRAAVALRSLAADLAESCAGGSVFVLDSGGPLVGAAQVFDDCEALMASAGHLACLAPVLSQVRNTLGPAGIDGPEEVPKARLGLVLLRSRCGCPRAVLSRLASSAMAPLARGGCRAVLAFAPNSIAAQLPPLQLHASPFECGPEAAAEGNALPPAPPNEEKVFEPWLELPAQEVGHVLSMEVLTRANLYSLCSRQLDSRP